MRKSFGAVELLKDMSLAANEGEFLALVGPSGCGKSTLLAIIAGLESATEGDVMIGDRRVNDVPPKDRDIAMVFQSHALYPTMTVRENMAFGMKSRRVPKDHQREAIARVAALLQIEAMTLATRIAVMHKGVLQQFDVPKVIHEHPSNLFVAGFMGSPSMNVLPATVAKGGRLHLSLGDGRTADLPTAPGQPLPAPGARVEGRVTLPVEAVEPTGSETMVVLRAAGQEVIARYEPDDAPEPGQMSDLVIDMGKASLFDPKTELRI
ncbi:MAG: ABC transporter ATP-binding protein [Rubellimicrobium sp.]|nr:ABC transporter ATP-binding protein [Rubellimicrobium sp.]